MEIGDVGASAGAPRACESSADPPILERLKRTWRTRASWRARRSAARGRSRCPTLITTQRWRARQADNARTQEVGWEVCPPNVRWAVVEDLHDDMNEGEFRTGPEAEGSGRTIFSCESGRGRASSGHYTGLEVSVAVCHVRGAWVVTVGAQGIQEHACVQRLQVVLLTTCARPSHPCIVSMYHAMRSICALHAICSDMFGRGRRCASSRNRRKCVRASAIVAIAWTDTLI